MSTPKWLWFISYIFCLDVCFTLFYDTLFELNVFPCLLHLEGYICYCFSFQSAIPQKGSEVNLTLGGIDLNNSGRLACFFKFTFIYYWLSVQNHHDGNEVFDSPLNTFFEQFSSVDVKVDKKLLTVLFPDGRDGRAFTLKVLLLLFLECFIFSFLFSPIYLELKFRCVENCLLTVK